MRILSGNTKKSTNKYMQSPYPCVYCDHSTEFGSGRFVNRIPADTYHELDNGKEEYREGYACADCMAMDCDRCGKSIDMDEDITPYDVFGDHGDFSDNAYRVHEECLTPKEKKLWEQFEQ